MPNQPMRRICTTSINRAPVFGSSLCATSFWIQPLCNQILVPASVQPVFGSSLCATSFWIQPLCNQFLDPASVQPVLGESLSYKECESLRIALIFCYRTNWMLWFLIWEQSGCCDSRLPRTAVNYYYRLSIFSVSVKSIFDIKPCPWQVWWWWCTAVIIFWHISYHCISVIIDNNS